MPQTKNYAVGYEEFKHKQTADRLISLQQKIVMVAQQNNDQALQWLRLEANKINGINNDL